MNINFKARLKHKAWWIGIISLVIILFQQMGFDLSAYIPKDYVGIINTIFAILTALGITVDTSTSTLSDSVISNITENVVQATNTTENVQTEATTTSINGNVTENSQENTNIQ